jgi:hypothetical protein
MYKNIQQHAVESTNIQFLAALSFVHDLVVASNYCYCTINSILQQNMHMISHSLQTLKRRKLGEFHNSEETGLAQQRGRE